MGKKFVICEVKLLTNTQMRVIIIITTKIINLLKSKERGTAIWVRKRRNGRKKKNCSN